MYLHNVVIGVFAVRTDPERDQDVVVELPELRDGPLPLEAFLVPLNK
jgi:hypothetical protein